MNKQFRNYVIFWASQSVSQLGSSMTAFALILWQYMQTRSAMAVALMSFCNYTSYVLLSTVSGSIVDRHDKKTVILLSDSAAAAATLLVFLLTRTGALHTWQVCAANAWIGAAAAFQSPASSVVIGKLVPDEKLANAGGMDSFSQNLVLVLAPILASALFGFGSLSAVVLLDLCSYGISCLVLLCFVHIPSDDRIESEQPRLFAGFSEGLAFLKTHRGLFILVLMMACMNFLSRITYENTLSPMILARSGGNTAALGLVNAVLGAAGIAGGLLASAGLFSKEPVRMVFWSAGFSFLFGDILMGLGRNVFTWCLAGAFASLPIAFVMAGQNVILYRTIPEEMQGRVFAVRNAIQYGTIPAGILLGGALADYVFEPFMAGSSALAQMLQHLVGSGTGCGMAVMFLCTGTIGACFSFLAYRQKSIQAMRKRCFSPPVIK